VIGLAQIYLTISKKKGEGSARSATKKKKRKKDPPEGYGAGEKAKESWISDNRAAKHQQEQGVGLFCFAALISSTATKQTLV